MRLRFITGQRFYFPFNMFRVETDKKITVELILVPRKLITEDGRFFEGTKGFLVNHLVILVDIC